MSNLNEIRNMKISLHAAVRKKQELDRKKTGQHVGDSIKSAIARKKKFNTHSSRGEAFYRWMSPMTACYAFFACAGVFMCFSLYQNVFAPAPGYTSSYLKAGDFKRAEKFVNSFLCGNLSEQDYYMPEKADVLIKSAAGLLPSFNGVPASSVVVSVDDDNKSIVLKATCPKETESAIIYLIPSGMDFHVSGIEIEKRYADEVSSL
ncbi:MAG TPA: hypothetical protein DET40_15410 [Lentisphaeria bacterium]|nr:MAG: hypothetical protein A2X45_05380 [Lentisphaerae bacterium GWF2_50_93]HCE44926.1 hypothetical protein [Lentisphaeria bacterium]